MKRMKHYNLTIILIIFSLVFMANPGGTDDTCVFSVTADDIPPNIVLLLDSGSEMEQIIWHSAYDNSVDYTPSVASEVDVVEIGGSTTETFGTLLLTDITNSNFFPGSIEGKTSGATADVTSWDGTNLYYENLSGGPFQVGEIAEETTRAPDERGSGKIAKITIANGFYNDNGYAIRKSGSDYILVEVPSDLDPSNHSYELEADTSDTSNKWGEWTINGRTIRLPAEPSTVEVDGVIDNANNFR